MSVYDRSAYASARKYRELRRKDLRDGALAGLLAGAAVMLLFLAYDLVSFTPLATPEFLSAALFGSGNASPAEEAGSDGGRLALFTVVHLATFVLLGIGLARLFRNTGVRRSLWAGGLYGFLVCTIIFSVSMQITGTEVSDGPGHWSIMAVNLAAGLVMVSYLRVAQGSRVSL